MSSFERMPEQRKTFLNREEAGSLLATELAPFRGKNISVMGIPRGGIPVAAVIADELKAPLDILLCKKIGHPIQKEYAIGAVSLNDSYLIPHEDVSESYIQEEIKKVRDRLRQMKNSFFIANTPPLANRIIILVDDGMATGRTAMAAIRLLRKSNPAKVVVAVPVASASALSLLRGEADQIICLLEPAWFGGVGAFYEHFEEVTDDEVLQLLQTNRKKFNKLASQ